MAQPAQRCCYCLRTDTERRPANVAAGVGAEECVDVDACIEAHKRRVERLTDKRERP